MSGLKLYLDELGWQVDTAGNSAYAGSENVRVTSEAHQAAIYADVVRRAACDPTIAEVNFFGLDDDRDRDIGWQAGLYRADGSPRAAAETVAAAVGEVAQLGCAGDVNMWRPAQRVVGAWARGLRAGVSGRVSVRVGALEGAQALACLFVGSASTSQSQLARRMQHTGAGHAGCRSLAVTPPRMLDIRLTTPAAGGTRYVGIRLTAEANAGRSTTLVVRPGR